MLNRKKKSRVSAVMVGGFLVVYASCLWADDQKPSEPPSPDFRLDVIRRAMNEDEVFKMSLGLSDATIEEDRKVRNQLLADQQSLDVLTWLSDYAEARANTDPDELSRFTARLSELPSATVRLVFTRLTSERERMRRQSASGRRARNQTLDRLRSTATAPSTASTVPSQGSSLNAYYGNNPYPSPAGHVRRRAYRVPEPLITARQTAAFAVYRMIFPRW